VIRTHGFSTGLRRYPMLVQSEMIWVAMRAHKRSPVRNSLPGFSPGYRFFSRPFNLHLSHSWVQGLQI
jgi:hypothetical protein